ncbi:phage terminase large subunit [Sphingomonas sp. RS2018]
MVRSPDDRPEMKAVLPALIRQRFDVFLRFAFRELAGNREFTPAWHIDAIERQLHLLDSREITQLIVTMPPRHLKSIVISVAWVAWILGREPQSKFTCASYDLDLAEKHARDCLKIIDSAWYRSAFPNMRLTKRAVLDFETYAGGGRLSTSVGGGVTGRGGDWIILDDPMKGDEALSDTVRAKTKDWFFNTLRSRADDDKTRYIIVMQRLHEEDLAGYLLRQGGWEELRLSAIATRDEVIPLLGGRVHYRREGYPLTPSRQSLAYLKRRQAEDPYVFAAQYQQDPIGRIGAFVMPDWFKTYDEPPWTGHVAQSWDTAVKATVRSDWSVGITARFYQGRWYILDVFRERVEFSDLYAAVRASCTKYKVEHLLIEDASSGAQLIERLRREMGPNDPYAVAVTPTGEKVARFEAQASRIKDGQVVLPRTAPWLHEFLAEVTRFPGGGKDDQADALAQLLANPPPVLDLPINAGPETYVEDEYGGSWSGGDWGDGGVSSIEDDGWGPS